MTASDPYTPSLPSPASGDLDPIKEFYARDDTVWDPANAERLERFVAAYREHRARLGRAVSILDLGCGRVPYLATRTEDGDDYWATDIAPPHVEVQHFVLVDFNTFEGADTLAGRTFDVIYCGELIEHVFSPDSLLEWLK